MTSPGMRDAITDALNVAAQATTDPEPEFEHVPDGYYTRRDIPVEEVDAALNQAGLHRNSTGI
ncbi:hypothetical protein [Streptomyces sp. NPDC055140]